MFLDIGFGILWSIFVAEQFGIEVTYLVALVGILSALAPDIDMLTYLFPEQSRIRLFLKGHRGLIHRPIVWVPFIGIVYFTLGMFWASVFAGGVLFHFIHDTIGLGWGIKWLWPFSKKSYRFFPDKDGKLSNTFFIAFTDEEKRALQKEYHNPNWVRDFYTTFNLVSTVEYGTLFVALVFLLIYLT